MIANPELAQVLAGRNALLVDLVTLQVQRGRIWQFPGGTPTEVPIVDTVRWTSANRRLRTQSSAPGGAATFEAPPGLAYKRDRLSSETGSTLAQISMRLCGDLAISLSTAADGSGAFATTLGELALLEMLDGSWITIDQAAVADLPSAPVQGTSGYGDISPDPIRLFGGVVRRATPKGGMVTLDIVDPLALGGGPVPRHIFSPLCRWEFCEGSCPVGRTQGVVGSTDVCTHRLVAGSAVTFPDASTVHLPTGLIYIPHWSYLVPLDGSMMGMRFQVGGDANDENDGYYDFADSMPWAWDCTACHIEYSCSHKRDSETPSNGRVGDGEAQGCSAWGATSSFGGFPEMPDPESGE